VGKGPQKGKANAPPPEDELMYGSEEEGDMSYDEEDE